MSLPASVRLALAKYGATPTPGVKPTEQKKKGGQQQGERKAPLLAKITDGDFGDLKINQSQWRTDRVFTELSDLTAAKSGQEVWVRSRVQSTRGMGKVSFMVLRTGFATVQVIADSNSGGITRDCAKYCAKLPCESIVDICATVAAAKVASCSQGDVELQVKRIYAVHLSAPVLPFKVEDASNPPPKKGEVVVEVKAPPKHKQQKKDKNAVIHVGQDTRLDNRWMDLRTPANHAIFRIQAAVCRFFRNYFDQLGFTEIHTPKLISGVSEGGSDVFKTNYFGRTACLAQSPQLYKQMAVVSDLFKVYEIGPVFRAEDSNTPRHMCEFVGMDFEMAFKEHYHEALAVLGNLFVYIFDSINEQCKPELAAIRKQYGVAPLKYKKDTLVLDYKEAVGMLAEIGEEVTAEGGHDFSTANEKALGKLCVEKYDTDLVILDKWPMSARPFYTMPDPSQPGYTNSYDVFLRGQEITSGAQRIHDPALLKQRATECDIPLEGLTKYLESFKYGAFPHAGAGIGLERVVMLFLGVDNVRKTSLFPRTPKRLEP